MAWQKLWANFNRNSYQPGGVCLAKVLEDDSALHPAALPYVRFLWVHSTLLQEFTLSFGSTKNFLFSNCGFPRGVLHLQLGEGNCA